jgi:Flp pilus assembly protein TadG
LRSLIGDRAGTTAVEFAIVAPMFLAMLFGVFEMGWAFHCNQTVDYATTTAARSLIANPSLSQSQLQTKVQTLAGQLADNNGISVALSEDASNASPRLARVTATYTHSFTVPFLSAWHYTYNTKSVVTLSP